MIKINKISWGKVRIDGKPYSQVLLAEDEVLERDDRRLHQLFGTTHEIGDWEQEKLLANNPEVILVANGWSGLLKINEKLKMKIEKMGIRLKVVLTPKVVGEYNQLVKEGKRVNALIHTTC